MPVSTDLILTSTLADSGTLNRASGITSQTLNGHTYVYVTSEYSRNVTVFEAFSDGTLDEVGRFDSSYSNYLGYPSALQTAVVNGKIYVYMGTSSGDEMRVLEQGADGSLTQVQLIEDDAALEINNNFGELTVASVGTAQFLVVHGYDDDGLSVFRIGNDGHLTNTFNIDDSVALGLGLDGAFDTAVARVGNTTFLVATGHYESALTIFEMTATGRLVLRSGFADTADMNLRGASGVESITIKGTTFLYAGGMNDDGISVFSLDGAGSTTHLFNIDDTAATALNGLRDIDIFTFNGTNYLVATGSAESGISYFEIADSGALTLLDSVFDGAQGQVAIGGVHEVDFFEVDGQGFVAVTGASDDSVSLFQVSANVDPIEGTADRDVLVGTVREDEINGAGGDDVLLGLDGGDTINGNGGDDVITGGDGNDVLIGDGEFSQTASDVVTIGQTGQDLALNVTLPDMNNGASIEISGLINRQPTDTGQFNIVYVIDVSGSMADPFVGNETVGDLNGDGQANTLLDGTIAAFQSLNGSIVQSGFGSADASIITFDTYADLAFEGTTLIGVENALGGLRANGATNFEAALQSTVQALSNAGEGENVVYFLSDGEKTAGGSFTDEVATLLDANGLNATINAIGLGATADLPALDRLDDGIVNGSATRVLTPSTLTASLVGSPVETSEVERLEIYVNDVLQRTLDGAEFALTPLGLQYNAMVDGLSTTAGDVIDVKLVASDRSATEVAVSLTVPNAVPGFGDDLLMGGNGDDRLEGNAGNDSLFGGNGHDGLVGGSGDDILKGGNGNDRLLSGNGNDTLIGGMGADTLSGGSGDDFYHIDRFDVIDESAGAATDFDTIVSRLSIDLRSDKFIGSFEGARLVGTADVNAIGTADANRLVGNDFDNLLFGLAGNDSIFAGAGDDRLYGAVGNDILNGDDGDDRILGGDGFDTVSAGNGDDTVDGGNGRDVVFLNRGNDLYLDNGQGGNLGQDKVYGGFGNDTIEGGNGSDWFFGESGNDVINGRLGNDSIYGGDGFDTISSGAGADVVHGGNGADLVFLNQGNDLYVDNGQGGAAGRDKVFGGLGNDTIRGGGGDDVFLGEVGHDVIFGGQGNDTLLGGAGADTLNGGAGSDTFVFAAADAGRGRDVVQGYELGTDVFELRGANPANVSTFFNRGSGQVTVSVNGSDLAIINSADDLSGFDVGDILFA